MEFHELLPAQYRSPTSPIFLFGAVDRTALAQIFRRVHTPSVGYHRIRETVVSKNGVISADADVKLLQGCGLRPGHPGACRASRMTGSSVLFDERLDSSLRNWPLDIPYRLWVLHCSGLDLQSIHYLLSPELASAATGLLSALGIGQACVRMFDAENEQLLVDDLLIPTSTGSPDGLSPMLRDALDFYDRQTGMLHQEAGERFRVFTWSITGTQGHLQNGPELAEIAGQFGYVRLDFNTRLIHEQKRMLSEASALVVIGDQTLPPVLPRQPGCAVCCLVDADCAADFVQPSIATVMDQHVGYVFGSNSQDGERLQDFRVDPDDFESALRVIEIHASL